MGEGGAGASDTRAYPWGDATPTCALTNFWGQSGRCVGDTSAVGSYPGDSSAYGLLDMAGNVFERVNDWWSSTYYSSSPHSNPTGPATGDYRVWRGGSWGGYDNSLRATYRNNSYPMNQGDSHFGFRCVTVPTR